jgi:putative endonuclease
MPTWFVYIALCSDGSLYTGITTDPQRRQQEHNSPNKGAKYTKSRQPVTLHVISQLDSRSEALKQECGVRKLKKRAKLDLLESIRPPKLHCNNDEGEQDTDGNFWIEG